MRIWICGSLSAEVEHGPAQEVLLLVSLTLTNQNHLWKMLQHSLIKTCNFSR